MYDLSYLKNTFKLKYCQEQQCVSSLDPVHQKQDPKTTLEHRKPQIFMEQTNYFHIQDRGQSYLFHQEFFLQDN